MIRFQKITLIIFKMITTKNPATGKILTEYSVMSSDEALSSAEKVFNESFSWRKTKFFERKKLFIQLAKILRDNKKRYAEMITCEMGKIIRESLLEVEKCAVLAETLAEHGEKWLDEELVNAGGEKHIITYEPLGTIYLIMPWNYPFWQPFKVALLPLFAGNTIILKHAKNVTGSAILVEEAFRKSGFPENVFKTLIIDHDTSDLLIDSEFVQGVSLTGSVSSGAKVASRAAKNIKKSVLELGGSDPFIILEDADIEKAAIGAVMGRMGNCGQVCVGAKRIIVNESIAEKFSKRYAELVTQLKQGDPMDPKTDIGPVVDLDSLNDMEEFVKDAKSKGAKILTGGERFGNEGCYYKPTVISQTTKDMSIINEEVFGPVVPIIIVKDDDEAVRVANKSIFGLSATIWTNNLSKGEELARKLECGGVFINHISASHPLLPLGGIKMSGYGRELSHIGIKEFMNIKQISVYK